MSNSKDNNESDDIDFSWGKKRGRGGKNKEVQFYESFTYDGVEYSLFDSVYLCKEGEALPYIGKLIKIWEHANKAKKVKVLWFFYPSEISNYLKGENVLENELFLASGVGKGLANVNPLEAIAGKCNVVCISKDERNRQPSIEEVKMAHYLFYRTFDVQNHTISDTLGEKIAMTEVNLLLNKNVFQSLDLPMVGSGNASVGLENSLLSFKDTLVADSIVEPDPSVVSLLVKDDKGVDILLDKSKGHPVGKIDAAGPDTIGLAAGRKRKLVNEDPGGINEDVDYDGRVGYSLVKDDKGSTGKVDAAGPDNIGPVALPDSEVALASDSKQNDVNEIRVVPPVAAADSQTSKSVDAEVALVLPDSEVALASDSKQNDVNEIRVVPPVAAADSKTSEDNHKAIGAVAKVKSAGKPSKKIKTDGNTPLSSNNGGPSTPATVKSNKGSQSVGVATDSNNRGKLAEEIDGMSNGLSKNLKSDGDGVIENNSIDKLREVSLKRSKGKQSSAAIYIAANKYSQSADGNAETDAEGKMSEKMVGTSNGLSKKLKSNSTVEDRSSDKLRTTLVKESKGVELEAYGCVKDVTERPPDRSKWFTASPWEERMKDAHDQGRLVLLQNLDPTYTSSEVENIVWHGFGENCTAKVVQHTATSSQSSGQAFVIFKTQEVAEKIVKKLDKECLMLPNGRPLIGSREVVCFPGRHSQFPGHLVVDKLRFQMQRESKAVSTSHSAQPNTVEYEMALEWRLLQDRSDLSWKMLHKTHGEQIKKLMTSLKSK